MKKKKDKKVEKIHKRDRKGYAYVQYRKLREFREKSYVYARIYTINEKTNVPRTANFFHKSSSCIKNSGHGECKKWEKIKKREHFFFLSLFFPRLKR